MIVILLIHQFLSYHHTFYQLCYLFLPCHYLKQFQTCQPMHDHPSLLTNQLYNRPRSTPPIHKKSSNSLTLIDPISDPQKYPQRQLQFIRVRTQSESQSNQSKSIDQYISMSLRKTKKKKAIKLPQDKEKIATEKLFEISWMCEEKQQDQSEVLIDHYPNIDPKTQLLNKISTPSRIKINKSIQRIKTYSLGEYRKMQEVERIHKIEQDIANRTTNCIFNTLNSRRVFVGRVKSVLSSRSHHIHTKEYETIERKRKVQTMPNIHFKSTSLKAIEDYSNQVVSVREQLKKLKILERKKPLLNTSTQKQLVSQSHRILHPQRKEH